MGSSIAQGFFNRGMAASDGSTEFVWDPYTKECPSCGVKDIPEGFEYCGKCGEKLGEQSC